ncbi:MAG: hypothetical protein ABIK67_00080 [candidate division WOR-3 bacterium]
MIASTSKAINAAKTSPISGRYYSGKNLQRIFDDLQFNLWRRFLWKWGFEKISAIEGEGRLKNFLVQFRQVKQKINELVKFHTKNKLLFMAYNQVKLKN